MEPHDKILYFEYTISQLLQWKNSKASNDFSVLKLMKLLFFVTAAKASKSEKNILLDTTFNNFYAMPYGHVESTIYNSIKEKGGELNFFNISNDKTTQVKEVETANLELSILKEIDESINYLKGANKDLVNMSSFELVNLSHSWYSWQFFFNKAKELGAFSYKIDNDIIKKESKIFSLELL